ncbi:MAG: DUF4830 domain-containing protein [Ruminococcus sp.]|nr:DUF4830 domain-containing protein [Ruminococcus sp.]
MFVRSVKLKRPGLLLAVIGALITAFVVFAVIKAAAGRKVSFDLRTEADRLAFIRQMGWETSDKYSSCRSVTIPKEFSDVYEQYNELQKQQGFDLGDYKGRTAEIYTYPIYNYEGHTDKDCMQLTLIIADGTLIGGDVCCTELGGFMQGLRRLGS